MLRSGRDRMYVVRSRLPSLLLAVLAAATVAARAPAWAQQPAAAPPAPATAASPSTPPSWTQGRPDSPAVANLAPVASPPIPTPADKLPVAKLKLPKGFNLEIYAAGLTNARSLRVD